mgnify:CR=1 FL=1
MNTVAIIPARSGSKGIPGKNILPIQGKPMISYSIEQAIASEKIDRVIVSTDCHEIAEIAEGYGAEVPFIRPKILGLDHVLDFPVFEHAINYLQEKENYDVDTIVHLRPTTPYRRIHWIEDSIALLKNNMNAHSVRSVSLARQHPYRMFNIKTDGFLSPIMAHEHESPFLLRRQDLPKVYYYNCVLDVTRVKTLNNTKSMTGTRILPYVLEEDEVIDIDTPLDLEIFKSVFMRKL